MTLIQWSGRSGRSTIAAEANWLNFVATKSLHTHTTCSQTVRSATYHAMTTGNDNV